jgi:hypothetical protein
MRKGWARKPTPLGWALSRGVVLDDELNFARDRNLGALRATNESRLQLVELDVKVFRNRGEDIAVNADG